MKVSRQWLQKYFDVKLKDASKIAEALTFHAFEIEGVEKRGADDIIDVDVLANRSSDCLSHRGIAKEVAAALGTKIKDDPYKRTIDLSPQSPHDPPPVRLSWRGWSA